MLSHDRAELDGFVASQRASPGKLKDIGSGERKRRYLRPEPKRNIEIQVERRVRWEGSGSKGRAGARIEVCVELANPRAELYSDRDPSLTDSQR